jgi:phosphate transport system permease protein
MVATNVQNVRDITAHPPGLQLRKFKDGAFIVWGIVATIIGLGTLVALVNELVSDGGHRLTAAFFMSFPSSNPAEAGILSAWVGSLLVIITFRWSQYADVRSGDRRHSVRR